MRFAAKYGERPIFRAVSIMTVRCPPKAALVCTASP